MVGVVKRQGMEGALGERERSDGQQPAPSNFAVVYNTHPCGQSRRRCREQWEQRPTRAWRIEKRCGLSCEGNFEK